MPFVKCYNFVMVCIYLGFILIDISNSEKDCWEHININIINYLLITFLCILKVSLAIFRMDLNSDILYPAMKKLFIYFDWK